MSRSLILFFAVALPFTLEGRESRADEPLKPIHLIGPNTDQDEDDPHLSSSGTVLFFTAKRGETTEVQFSSRRAASGPWSARKPFPELKGKADFGSVFLTPDGRFPQYLFYASNNDPENNQKGDNFDLYFLLRQSARGEFSSKNAVIAVDTPADEMHPWLTPEGKFYFSRKEKNGWRVYLSLRSPRGQFGKPVPVSLPVGYHHVTLTPDGKTMYMQGPLENNRWGLFQAAYLGNRWSEPEPLKQVNSPEAPTGDRSPSLSRDGTLLYFASDRPGGKGGLDLWAVPTAQLNKK